MIYFVILFLLFYFISAINASAAMRKIKYRNPDFYRKILGGRKYSWIDHPIRSAHNVVHPTPIRNFKKYVWNGECDEYLFLKSRYFLLISWYLSLFMLLFVVSFLSTFPWSMVFS